MSYAKSEGKDQVFFVTQEDMQQPEIEVPALKVSSAPSSSQDDQEFLKHTVSAPFDARFPNQNQSRNCWQNYIDFHRCRLIKGEDFKPCNFFKRSYHSLCPSHDIQAWDDALEEGNFQGNFTGKRSTTTEIK